MRELSGKAWVWLGVGAVAVALVVAAVYTSGSDEGGWDALSGLGSGSAGGSDEATGGGSLGGPGALRPDGTSVIPTDVPQAGMRPTVSAPVAEGAKLVTITVPPQQTLAFVDAGRATADSEYAVTFRVYGKGSGGASVVIAVDDSKPAAGVAEAFDFRGRNVLARLSGRSAQVVVAGGQYTGTLVLRRQGEVLEPWLQDAKPK